jgi:hypothetical protein
MNLKIYATLGVVLFLLYTITAFKIVEGIPQWVQHFSFFALTFLALVKVMQEKRTNN